MSQLREALLLERDKQETILFDAFVDAAYDAVNFLIDPTAGRPPGLFAEWDEDSFFSLDTSKALYGIIYFCNDDDGEPDVEFRLQVEVLRCGTDRFTGGRITLHRRTRSMLQGSPAWVGIGQVQTIADIARLLELDKETE